MSSPCALHNTNSHQGQPRGRRRARPCSQGRPITDGVPIIERLNVSQAIDTARLIHAANAKTLLSISLGEAVIVSIMHQCPREEVTESEMMAAYKLVTRAMFPDGCVPPQKNQSVVARNRNPPK